MVSESGMRLPEGEKLDIRDDGDGMYIVENGYSGAFEYFEGRPIEVEITSHSDEKSDRGSAVRVRIAGN